MTTLKTTAIAALTIATVSAGMMGATSTAQAGNGNFVKGLVAGAIVGGVIHHATRHNYRSSYRECWYETRKRWDHDGYPYYVKVKICD